MQKTSLVAAVLVLASTPILAQAITFPPGFETTEADSYGANVGSYTTGHFQYLYGDYQGVPSAPVRNFKAMALRRDATAARTNTARTWGNVQIQVCDTDYRRLSDTYSDNYATTPTKVFSGSMNWPANSGVPTTTPGQFGNFAAVDDMKWVFGTGGTQANFLHLGVMGFLIDIEMTSGSLAGAYYYDAISNNNQFNDISGTNQASGGTGCTTGYFTTWLMSDRLPGNQAQHRAQPYMRSGIPNTNYIGVIGLEAMLTTSVPFPGSCNHLWYDFSKPYVPFPYMTDAVGEFYLRFVTAPWVPNSLGLRIDTQAAYADTATNSMQLTIASRTAIPALPTLNPVYFASHLYRADTASPIGYGPIQTSIPVFLLYD